ncbi:MAG: hypothetical protein FWD15_01505 [Alphaproteobacteria bacterium]|nr:hypothetical protein [Alphaproteobacteria bacterium]
MKKALFCFILCSILTCAGAAGRVSKGENFQSGKNAPELAYAPGSDVCLSVSDLWLGGCPQLAQEDYDSVYIYATQYSDDYVQDSLVFKMKNGKRINLTFKGCGPECSRGLPVDDDKFDLIIRQRKGKRK